MATRNINEIHAEAFDRVLASVAAQADMTPEMLGFASFNLDMTEGFDPMFPGSQPLVEKRKGMKNSERMLWGFKGPSAAQLSVLDADQTPVQFGKVNGVRTILSGDPRRLHRLETLSAECEMGVEHEADGYTVGINWLMRLSKSDKPEDKESYEILLTTIQEGIYDE